MYRKITEKLFSLAWWQSWLSVFFGSLLLAGAFVLFINPYKIVPGGVYGLGIVMHSIFPDVQVGTFGFMFDVPLLIISFRVFGGMFGARTIVAAMLMPLLMNVMTYFIGENPATMLGGKIDLSQDMIITCIFGGVLVGAGMGLVIRTQATTGGTDIVAMLLKRFFHIPFSKGILIVDSFVIIFGIIVLGDWRLPLYALVTLFVSSRVIDYVIDGASYDKLLFIISDKHEELRSFILDDLSRGATYIKSTGMYTGSAKEMIFLVVSRREVASVQNQIKSKDPQAFVVVVDAYDTYGDGFKSFPEGV